MPDEPESIRMVLADPMDSPEDRVRPHRLRRFLTAVFGRPLAIILAIRWLNGKDIR